MDTASLMVRKYAGRTVLAIGAHPDDLELGVGGTLALLARSGVRVVNVVVSVPNNLEKRLGEARRGAEILGAEIVVMNETGCSRVEDMKTYELVERVDQLIVQLDPAAVLSHGVTNFHKDHLMVYNACLAAQRLHFFDFFCYNPTSCRPFPAPFRPQAFVDITATMDLKMEAISVHSTQFGCRGLEYDYYKDVARQYGRLAGVTYAEGLEVMRLKLN
jgi:N-acetylglucosamine malate deacetylase 1